MSFWLPIAIVGHLFNAGAFLVDKVLLSSAFKRSGTYAALMGGLSCFVFIAAPFTHLPSLEAWPSILAFGALFVLAIWMFFESLRRAEATRVVPIIGSLIPVFTLIDTSIFLGERLSDYGYLGFGFLVLATGMLAGGRGKNRIALSTIGICVLSAILFAASSTFGKNAFHMSPFLDVFVWSRLSAILFSLCILLFAPGVKKEFAMLFSGKKAQKKDVPSHFVLMFFGQACGAIGFLFVQYAISQGSAALVNALQAVQYAALVLVAWLGGTRLAHLLQERRDASDLIQKGFAVMLVAIGLFLVTYGA